MSQQLQSSSQMDPTFPWVTLSRTGRPSLTTGEATLFLYRSTRFDGVLTDLLLGAHSWNDKHNHFVTVSLWRNPGCRVLRLKLNYAVYPWLPDTYRRPSFVSHAIGDISAWCFTSKWQTWLCNKLEETVIVLRHRSHASTRQFGPLGLWVSLYQVSTLRRQR